jgi:hypothetical protein
MKSEAMKRVKHVLLFVLIAVMAIPLQAAAEEENNRDVQEGLLAHVSQQVALRFAATQPDAVEGTLREAGERLREIRAEALARVAGSGSTRRAWPGWQGGYGAQLSDRFNLDDVGLPQNEESVAACPSQPKYVLSGANDYRYLLDPELNSTGYYFSTDGGRSVTKEGLLPSIASGGEPANLPSGGDPVIQTDRQCNFYFLDLNYPADNPFANRNGIGLYRTTLENLKSCPAGDDPDQLTQPACWPDRKLVAFADIPAETGIGSFLDKPWFDVGPDGAGGKQIWITYSDFANDPNAPLGFTGAQIKAVHCDADTLACEQPIVISGTDEDIQFSDVTIANDGSTLITWAQIEGELEETAQVFTVKAVVIPPGSTTPGPTRIVNREVNPIPFSGFLHANDFRVATYPKSIMPMVNGKPRMFVVWDRCQYNLLDSTCEESQIYLTWSNDMGETWSKPVSISKDGDNYFPAISDEYQGTGKFAVAWFTNRRDPIFHNRQDVELVLVGKYSGRVLKRQWVTRLPNESEADPILGGAFIGDYIDVDRTPGVSYVAYNANYRKIKVLGEGFPVPQQDNYLTPKRG